MIRKFVFPFVCILLAVTSSQGADVADELIICGWDEVAILDMSDPPRKIWGWKADTCSTLPDSVRTLFATTDDCKPIDGGEKILITSSGRGIALVERKTGRALFWAQAPNAHSADLLPNNRVAVASSGAPGGNRLIVYDLAASGREVLSRDLPWGHGVVWDPERKFLYALAISDVRVFELVKWETDTPDLKRVAVYDLPERGGHELFPLPDSPHLMVSSENHCWLFDRDTGAIIPHPSLADRAGIKSVDVNPRTGQIAYLQAEGDHWCAERFHFLHPESVYHVTGEHFYKARWNVRSH